MLRSCRGRWPRWVGRHGRRWNVRWPCCASRVGLWSWRGWASCYRSGLDGGGGGLSFPPWRACRAAERRAIGEARIVGLAPTRPEQLITYRGRVVRAARPASFSPMTSSSAARRCRARLGGDDVCVCERRRAGVLAGPYDAADGCRYARAALIPGELLERPALHVDRAAGGASRWCCVGCPLGMARSVASVERRRCQVLDVPAQRALFLIARRLRLELGDGAARGQVFHGADVALEGSTFTAVLDVAFRGAAFRVRGRFAAG